MNFQILYNLLGSSSLFLVLCDYDLEPVVAEDETPLYDICERKGMDKGVIQQKYIEQIVKYMLRSPHSKLANYLFHREVN